MGIDTVEDYLRKNNLSKSHLDGLAKSFCEQFIKSDCTFDTIELFNGNKSVREYIMDGMDLILDTHFRAKGRNISVKSTELTHLGCYLI